MSTILELPDTATDTTTRLKIIDCDIHPALGSARDLDPFLSARWRQHLAEYGKGTRGIYTARGNYPRFMPQTARRDAWPKSGPPGSDVDMIRTQHLDPNDVAFGILEPLLEANSPRNQDLQAALCTAFNDWQLATFTDVEPRLRSSILVPQDDAEAAVAEIERRADDPRFAQIQLSSRTPEPLGRRRYWPIFAAAEQSGLPIGLHVGGPSASAPSASGWPSFYVEEHQILSHSMPTQAASLILEGVFDRYPRLKVVMIEGGFAWVPILGWRLDATWSKMRSEIPDLKLKPSEYFRRNLWFSTQPMEEPERPRHLRQVLEWIGFDRLVYSSDYPHWDYDDPRRAIKVALSDAEHHAIFRGNAEAIYRF
jgi:hypothetical protein